MRLIDCDPERLLYNPDYSTVFWYVSDFGDLYVAGGHKKPTLTRQEWLSEGWEYADTSEGVRKYIFPRIDAVQQQNTTYAAVIDKLLALAGIVLPPNAKYESVLNNDKYPWPQGV